MGGNNKRASWNIRWNSVVEKTRKYIGGDQEEAQSIGKFGGYKTEVKERTEGRKGKASARTKEVKEEKHLEVYGGLGEDIGMKTYLHGPMDYAKKLKLRFSCRGPASTRNKKEIYQ